MNENQKFKLAGQTFVSRNSVKRVFKLSDEEIDEAVSTGICITKYGTLYFIISPPKKKAANNFKFNILSKS